MSGASHGAHERPALAWLYGARVERVDAPEPTLLSCTLFNGETKRCLLFSVAKGAAWLGMTDTRPKGLPATGFVRRLRVALENARLVSATWITREAEAQQALALVLRFARKGVDTDLLVDFDAAYPNVMLIDAERRVLGALDERGAQTRFGHKRPPYVVGRGRGAPIPEDAAHLSRLGSGLLGEREDSGEQRCRDALRAAARASLRKVERRIGAIRGDLERAHDAPRLRREASLLLCHLKAVPRGAASITLRDEAVDPCELVTFALDPAFDARTNAQRKFDRARKVERGTHISLPRLRAAEAEATALRELLLDADNAALELLPGRAASCGITLDSSTIPAPQRRIQKPTHVPYRSFKGSNGTPILVGKGAADNDTLTLTVARPYDLWLHARGVQGAHVIVPCVRNVAPSAEQVLDAAHLAAHFSDVRGEPTVEVQTAARRYVRKPKGAAAGAVLVDREKVVLLRVEPARLARLLATEQRT